MFDIIYVTWFVHITTALFSSKFWYFYLVVRVRQLSSRRLTNEIVRFLHMLFLSHTQKSSSLLCLEAGIHFIHY